MGTRITEEPRTTEACTRLSDVARPSPFDANPPHDLKSREGVRGVRHATWALTDADDIC